MPDERFFTPSQPVTIKSLAETYGARLECPDGRDVGMIEGVASLQEAGPGDLTFLSNPRYLTKLSESQASACILADKHRERAPSGMALLVADDPYVLYAKIANAFYATKPAPRVSEHAAISETASIGDGCFIAAGAVIGEHVVIGERCYIGPNVSVSYAEIGNDCMLHAGVAIGQDGFGFAFDKGTHVKVPQLGRVMIGDDVEIGANSCIDRGAGPDTVIGSGTKIDNLVQIGHNVVLGKGCIVVAQVGIAGSACIGDYAVIGGQVGIGGHLTIGPGVQVAAQSGVVKDVDAGEKIGGSPAMPLRQWHRNRIALEKLLNSKGT